MFPEYLRDFCVETALIVKVSGSRTSIAWGPLLKTLNTRGPPGQKKFICQYVHAERPYKIG